MAKLIEKSKSYLQVFTEHRNWRKFLLNGSYGLEMEVNRILYDGQLSDHPYPAAFGDRRTHPFLQSDYTEGMMELVTPVRHSLAAAHQELRILTYLLQSHLSEKEALWPLSLPPVIEPEKVVWLDNFFEKHWEADYHKYLLARYGSVHGIISGPHINIGINEALLSNLFKLRGAEDWISFKNKFYFKLAQGLEANRGLLIYLFGASPLAIAKTDYQIPADLPCARSIRNSVYGYVNSPDLDVNYHDSFEQHVNQLENAVQSGMLYASSEFYGTVRFKGHGNYQALLQSGIEYLELRVIDTNPFSSYGLSLADLEVINLIILWIIIFEKEYSTDELIHLRQKADQLALSTPENPFKYDKTILHELSVINNLFDGYFNQPLSRITRMLNQVDQTPANQLLKVGPNPIALQNWARKTAKKRQTDFLQYQFQGSEYDLMARRLAGLD
ncbi:glutamate-cysteine ligase [Weissella oryzae SG25]|uniref:Glutamate--cysteine ligase n=1 Tax=Weissella oryzae (strain DSM 25784 / JCM 18191 / LMG 30913 / SG25) TaxID=1329250 RepID=A0A069CUR3_WEIOS|nr:hypothetical protein [Weissella oryzae]GAK31214.1 glutamate-cysteine ligase [Weissella oryzae SG25]